VERSVTKRRLVVEEETCASSDVRLFSFPADGKSKEVSNCALERQSVDGTSRGAKSRLEGREKRKRVDEWQDWGYDTGSRRVGGIVSDGHRRWSDDYRRGNGGPRIQSDGGVVPWS
jgi:hypothetical protein